jgi:hypothetical protein
MLSLVLYELHGWGRDIGRQPPGRMTAYFQLLSSPVFKVDVFRALGHTVEGPSSNTGINGGTPVFVLYNFT